jgi:hypothetical protein
MRKTDFNTLNKRGKSKRKSMGDKELASLEMNIYGVPRIISEGEFKPAGGGSVEYTDPKYHRDGTVTPGRPIPPK